MPSLRLPILILIAALSHPDCRAIIRAGCAVSNFIGNRRRPEFSVSSDQGCLQAGTTTAGSSQRADAKDGRFGVALVGVALGGSVGRRSPAFRQRRCLVAVDAWYECVRADDQKIPHASGSSRLPETGTRRPPPPVRRCRAQSLLARRKTGRLRKPSMHAFIVRISYSQSVPLTAPDTVHRVSSRRNAAFRRDRTRRPD
jgi:hypothetical protein